MTGPAGTSYTGPTGAFQTGYNGQLTVGSLIASDSVVVTHDITCETIEGQRCTFTFSNFDGVQVTNGIDCSTIRGDNCTFRDTGFDDIHFNDGTEIWDGVQQTVSAWSVTNNVLPQSLVSSQVLYHLGTWAAPIGGVVLKLNVVSCIGININASITTAGAYIASGPGPQIIDLTILFYTTNNRDYISLPNGVVFPGYGWCESTHVTNFPAAVYVQCSNTQAQPIGAFVTFDFWMQSGPMIGNPAVSVLSNNPTGWKPDYGGAYLPAAPQNAIKLPIASAMTSMCKNYVSR